MKLKGIPIKGIRIVGNKIEKAFYFRDASHRIRCKKSKRVSVKKGQRVD